MSEKRKMNPKSLENLEKGNLANKTPAERKEIARKGAEATNKIKAEKKSREEGNVFIWDRYFSTAEKMDEFWYELSTKDKAAILMAILPKDKQINELKGNIGFKTVFITPDEYKQTEDLIEQTFNEQ